MPVRAGAWRQPRTRTRQRRVQRLAGLHPVRSSRGASGSGAATSGPNRRQARTGSKRNGQLLAWPRSYDPGPNGWSSGLASYKRSTNALCLLCPTGTLMTPSRRSLPRSDVQVLRPRMDTGVGRGSGYSGPPGRLDDARRFACEGTRRHGPGTRIDIGLGDCDGLSGPETAPASSSGAGRSVQGTIADGGGSLTTPAPA